ncbi:MAG: alanine dehydrogenase [Acidiferrobacteraceae bacterium]|jgi:alanine dehydrogenase|nr:alanine dehydrogenase [Acidiferrobacteraceae bacterium]MDP6434088.1 alanine dehydrogenase [Arenicellales bacterium]MDP6672379.1 alanine dehydrogenase [Arenicellales bacterium]MDP6725278.1 alanine dehydrogenase [Arenicellales bacterium]MDP7284416.1 alanine dehydrogenase [Arenicellales bacterium]|tara:strand:+ start:17520 stop:18635 length:1116 start_codon:yes stop_codon:yes gene_type:complete
MLIGVPKEVKNNEFRVGLAPANVQEVIDHGHQVIVQANAGVGIGATDSAYEAIGATIIDTPEEIFEKAEMIVKVKEPLTAERALLREGQVLFTYLHLAPDPDQTRELVDSGAVCIAYETVTSPSGGLPLLAPMSKVAGRMAVQVGAWCMEEPHGGLGMLLGGVPGVDPAKVVVIGGGVVGTHATHIAVGMGADVWVLDRDNKVLDSHWQQFGRSTNTVFSSRSALEKHVIEADLVIGGVLIPGAAAPKLVTREMVTAMKPGSVVVDVAIDQGGCLETSKPTTHAEPTYVVDDVVHYCVTNMPGGVPRTSTFALNNATLPFVLKLADLGYRQALTEDPHLLAGLNVHTGRVTCPEVAEALGYDCLDPIKAIN